MNVLRLICFLLLIPTIAIANDHVVHLGSSVVTIRQIQNGKGPTYVHLHQNEKTALRAARIMVARKGGRLMTLVHEGERNIVFYCHRRRYEFDPNRIFTDIGMRKTLKEYSHDSREARREVKKLANKIKQLLPKHGKIIAVHNNKKSYSLKSYMPGQASARDIRRIYVNRNLSYRNFYLVTQNRDYYRLKRLHFNSVLQKKYPSNDGSLSVYLSRRRYVNVEAGFDQLLPQIKMLRFA